MNFDEIDLYSGLATLHWSAYEKPQWDTEFYRSLVAENGGLALDVACGAGRLLRDYLRGGLQVEGVDISGGMLAVCRQKAAAEGLEPVLYEQPMQDLDLPNRYRTIFIPCGSFMCVMGRQNARRALDRFYQHLEPGGLLVFNTYLSQYNYAEAYDADKYPEEWRPHDEVELDHGRRLVVERRTIGVYPIEQIYHEERRYKLYEDDRLVQEESHVGQNHWYYKYEMLLMLELAGFSSVEVKGDYTEEEFGPHHEGTMVFLASK